MPVRRGHVAPQNTFLGVIIRKFEGQSEYLSRVSSDEWVRSVVSIVAPLPGGAAGVKASLA